MGIAAQRPLRIVWQMQVKYSLIQERGNYPLTWCWYAFHDGHTPEHQGLSSAKGVRAGGVYVAGFDNKQKALEYGINNDYVEI